MSSTRFTFLEGKVLIKAVYCHTVEDLYLDFEDGTQITIRTPEQDVLNIIHNNEDLLE